MNTDNHLKPAQVVPSSVTGSTDNNNQKVYFLSKYRFLMLSLYILSDLCNSITIFSFQTIAAQISKIYSLDPFLVSLNISVYSLMYPFVSFAASYLIDTYGASLSVKIGLLLTVIGSILRIYVSSSWNYVIISSIFCGSGGPLIFNAKCRYQSNWFFATDLPQITTISTIITTCNSVFGTLFPGIYFTGYDYLSDKSEGFQDGKDLLVGMVKLQAIIIGSISLVCILFLREKPFIPPSYVSTLDRERFCVSIRTMLKNRTYMKVNVASMIYVGTVTSLTALFSFVIQPWGFNQTHYVFCAAGMILGGILGAGINAQLLRKYKQFKRTLIVLLLWMALIIFVIGFVINTAQISTLIVFVSLFGFGYYPLASTTYELSCEIAYPIGEGSAQGFLMGNNSIFGFICITVFSLFVRGETKLSTYMLLMVIFICLIICSIIIYTSDIQLNRLKVEQQHYENIQKNKESMNIEQQQQQQQNILKQQIELQNFNELTYINKNCQINNENNQANSLNQKNQ